MRRKYIDTNYQDKNTLERRLLCCASMQDLALSTSTRTRREAHRHQATIIVSLSLVSSTPRLGFSKNHFGNIIYVQVTNQLKTLKLRNFCLSLLPNGTKADLPRSRPRRIERTQAFSNQRGVTRFVILWGGSTSR